MISRISRNVTAIYIVFGVIATFIVVSIYYTYEKLENISTSGSSGGLVLVKSKFRGARMSVSNVVSASMVTTQNLSMGAVVQIVRIKSADLNENFGSFTYIKISTFLNSFINQILNYARKENVTDSSLYAANTTHPSNMVTSNGSNSDFFPTLALYANISNFATSNVSDSEFIPKTRKQTETVTSSPVHPAVDSFESIRSFSNFTVINSSTLQVINTKKQAENIISSPLQTKALYAVRTSSPSLSPVFTSDFITKTRKQVLEYYI